MIDSDIGNRRKTEVCCSIITAIYNLFNQVCVFPVPIGICAEGLKIVEGIDGWSDNPLDVLIRMQDRQWVCKREMVEKTPFGIYNEKFSIDEHGFIVADPSNRFICLDLEDKPEKVNVPSGSAIREFELKFSFETANGYEVRSTKLDPRTESGVINLGRPSNKIFKMSMEEKYKYVMTDCNIAHVKSSEGTTETDDYEDDPESKDKYIFLVDNNGDPGSLIGDIYTLGESIFIKQ